MTQPLPKRDRRCHLVIAYAPPRTTFRAANDALNEYVADRARGLALFHDHFTDRAGGIALFAVGTESELEAAASPGPLAGWDVVRHPLIYSESAMRFLFQIDYTMTAYRGERLSALYDRYHGSDMRLRNDARTPSEPVPCAGG